MLEHKLGNYLVAVSRSPAGFGLSAVEVSTGEFVTMEFLGEQALVRLTGELARLRPSECLLPRELFGDKKFTGSLRSVTGMTVVQSGDEHFETEEAERRLLSYFKVPTLEGFGCAGKALALSAAGAIIAYLDKVRKGSDFCIDTLSTISPGDFLVLDSVSQRNLELVQSLRDGTARGTLLEVLDLTITPMGARLLRKWILQPLTDIPAIRARQGAVRELAGNTLAIQSAGELLQGMHDLERLNARASFGNASPRDILALGGSIRLAAELRKLFEGSPSQRLAALAGSLDPLEDLSCLIGSAIAPDAPATTREGGFIQDGHSPELDGLRASVREAKDWLSSLESKERERTGIRSLKVGFNRIFGYYIEVTRPNLGSVPANYIRKQTIANGERFITEELERYESIVLSAEEKMLAVEQRLFSELLARVALQGHRVLSTARAVSELDVLRSLAAAAARNNYCEPVVDDGEALIIKDGRHAVVERMFQPGAFVPNDTQMDCAHEQIMMITGPNMAGKSTYMRQVALIVILAQMGSFVPAKSARVGIVDRVFTRVGAADDLVRGQSTFMVEMIETANILNNATRRSLVLLDEIGRGTSTFDGLSIAWSVAEYLHNEPRAGCKTLFATHYHQLTELAGALPRVRNYHMPVKEVGEEIVFLRKVLPGSVDRSYGIQVARLAGLPRKVTERARQVLRSLEEENPPGRVAPRGKVFAQTTLFPGDELPHPVLEAIGRLDLMNLTPLQALGTLEELQKRLGTKKTAVPGNEAER